MPPFDASNPFGHEGMLATMVRLANDNDQSWRRTKKGDKRPAYDIEASKVARRANIKAKQAAALERILARQKAARPRVAAGTDIASRMLQAMQPGEWYGQGDLTRMTGELRSSRSKVHQVLMRRGWVERATNPTWCGERLTPQEIMGGAEPQPQHLYRLTAAGCEVRARLSEIDEPSSDLD